MPLAAQNRDRDYFFVAVTFDQKKYSLVGYAGALDLTDIAVLIMHVAGGHMVALPGASDRCFFIGTTAAWFGQALFIVLGGWVQIFYVHACQLYFLQLGAATRLNELSRMGWPWDTHAFGVGA